MTKQFLAIALLLSCAHSAKSSELAHLLPGLTVAAVTMYGINTAIEWGKPDQHGTGAVQTTGEMTARFYGVTINGQWGKPDHNAPGVFTTIGSMVGTTGLDTLKATNVAGLLLADWLLFPTTRNVVMPAAAVGFAYLAGNRFFLGANQETKPTDVNRGAALVLGMAGLGTLYKTNAFPSLNQMVDRALGRKPTPFLYRLIGYK